MKSLLLVITAGIIGLCGCSSTPTEVTSGSARAQTFSFVQRAPRPVGAGDERKPVHDLIHESISKNLQARGLQPAADGDITVAYLIVVGNNASTEMISDYFGYGRDFDELHNKAQKAYTKSHNPNYFEAGTLLIDIIDSKTFKLIKRGHATRPILRNPSQDARAANIQEAVDEILRDLRIQS